MSKRRIFQGYAAFILGCAFTLFGLCYSLRKPRTVTLAILSAFCPALRTATVPPAKVSWRCATRVIDARRRRVVVLKECITPSPRSWSLGGAGACWGWLHSGQACVTRR